MNLRPVRDRQEPAYPALDEVNAARRGFLQKLGLLAGVALTGAFVSGCDEKSPVPTPEPEIESTPSPPGSPPLPDPVPETAPPQRTELPIEEPPDQQTLGAARVSEYREIEDAESDADKKNLIERLRGGAPAPQQRE